MLFLGHGEKQHGVSQCYDQPQLPVLTLQILLLILCITLRAFAHDVEDWLKLHLCNEAIISTQSLVIPGYPNAYNPSLIPYKNGYLLSFRYVSQFPKTAPRYRVDASFIGLARCDKKYKISPKTVQLLNIQSYSSQFSLTAEDARLISFNDRIFLFFNDRSPFDPYGFSMYFGELIEEKGVFHLREPAKVLQYPFAISIEKNWSPFVSDNQLYVIYSDRPRTVLKVDIETGNCTPIFSETVQHPWNLGVIRGGTPAHLVNDEYLTFFHSSFPAKTPKKRMYVMGAYLFDKEPPFTIRSMTAAPLGTLEDYTQENDRKIVFPSGLVLQGDTLLVAWGKNDRKIQITLFDKKKLLNSLKDCPL